MNTKYSWPIRPKQISNDIELGFNETGIIPNMYLKGILTDMSLKTKYPFTFCEYCNNKLIITDGDTPRIRHNQVCLNKECENKNCLFYDFNKIKFNKFLCLYKKEIKNFTNKEWEVLLSKHCIHDLENQKIIINVNDTQISLYKYECYKNNKIEYSIPIIFQGSLLGILFAGLITDNQDFLQKIKPVLEELFGVLKKEIANLSNNFVARKIEDINKLLRNEFYKSSLPKGNQRLKRFWSKIQIPLDKLRESFPAKHVVVFAKDTMENSSFNSEFKAVVGSGLNIKHQNLIFRPSIVENFDEISKSQELNITSLNYPNLLMGLDLSNFEFNKKTDILRLFPSTYSPRSVFIIWVRYDINTWDRIGELKEDGGKDELFESAILSFYSLMGSIYSSVMAEIASELLELTIRVMGHEISQNLIVIEAIRYFKIETGNIIDNPSRLKAISDDLRSQITQIEYMDSNAKAVIRKNTSIEIESIHPLKDLIYKWVNTYKRKSRLRKIQFITPDYNSSFKMPFIKTDVHKLDQVVYNLINNAWKYCYPGTNIILNYGIKENDRTKVQISIVDYGKNTPPENINIYELFERGDNTRGIEGLGVGLGIAKQNMKLLGGKIYHISDKIKDKISDFNIPVLSYYIEVISNQKQINNHTIYKLEYDRLSDNKIIDNIVCKQNGKHVYKPSFDEIRKSINYSTFKVEFILELPNNN